MLRVLPLPFARVSPYRNLIPPREAGAMLSRFGEAAPR